MIGHRLTLVHPVDPRCLASGSADFLGRILDGRPDDFSILLVGVDASGDLSLGHAVELSAERRGFDFLPVASLGGNGARVGGRLAFRMGFMRHLGRIRSEACLSRASTELHDPAWAPMARLLGNPVVQVIRSPDDARYGVVRGLSELLAAGLASRIVADEVSARRLRDAGTAIAAKTEILNLEGSDRGREEDADLDVQRLYERHRRFFRIARVGMVRHAVA